MKQILTQRLQQKLSPQQILLMKLIQLPLRDLEMRLKREIEENPVLDENPPPATEEEQVSADQEEGGEFESEEREDEYYEDDYDYERFDPNRKKDEPTFFSLSARQSQEDELMDQASMKIDNESDLTIARYLIGSLDDSGYLRRDPGSLVDDLAFTQNIHTTELDVERVLKIVQELEPAGVGARDLRESLLIQLKRKNDPGLIAKNAVYIVEHLFDEFSHRRFERIIEKTGISESDLKDVISEIKGLNPKPGERPSDLEEKAGTIIPDFTVIHMDDDFQISLNQRSLPELRLNRSYLDMIENTDSKRSKSQRETASFIRKKVESAKWFIDAIKQREDTMLKTMRAIVSLQRDFFITGDKKSLKPMILKNVAEMIGMDISTISRVVNGKYVQTSFGIIELKKFFSESLTKESGEEVSTIEVKHILKEIIENENKSRPFNDEELTGLLKERGYPVARRTVAKYREQLEIPVARLRRKF